MYILLSKCRLHSISKKSTMFIHQHAKDIFQGALKSVQPQALIQSHVRLTNGQLIIKNKSFPLHKPCYMVGFGKAVLGMAVEMEDILGENLAAGIITVPDGIGRTFNYTPREDSRMQILEGALNNLPDANSLKGANKIKNLCGQLGDDDLLIVLISGGGSALLPLPREGIALQEKLEIIKDLASKGADILELNCVRKKLSQLKGGGLAESAFPSRVISLILSDIIGDPLDFIASGPTVRNLDDELRDPEEASAAMKIVRKYNLNIPEHIESVLNSSRNGAEDYNWVHNFIIGNNNLACESAKIVAENMGYNCAILSTKIQGDVVDISKMYAQLAAAVINGDDLASLYEKYNLQHSILNFNNGKDICIIGGGEPTVIVKGSGKGGRNQELALRFSKEIKTYNLKADIIFLSCGTDGIDGPTDAAGAIGTKTLFEEAIKQDIDPDVYLSNNDVYNFYKVFKNGDYLVQTGHTGTNVMDIHVLIIKQ